ATQLAGILLASQLPQLLFTPIAGALVDRWDRRWAMILADAGAGIGTLALASLLFFDSLEIWHLYIILSVSGVFQSFQWPAYGAATTLLVPKQDYTRAAGLVQLSEALGQVFAPAIAGLLLVLGGLTLVIALDVISFLFAVTTLLLVRFPAPKESEEGKEARGSLFDEAKFGFTYIRRRQGLFVLLWYFAALNLVFGFMGVVIFPVILGFADAQAMGNVFSIGAIGMVIGSVIMSAWKGPQHLVRGLILAVVGLGVGLVLIGLRADLVWVTVAAFLGFLSIPFGNGFSQAIWQRKVDPDVQGRVFAVRRTIAQGTGPIALIAAGPLVDRLFEPALAANGSLAGSVGELIGTGPGRGAAFFMILMGLASITISLAAYSHPRLRNLEKELPDVIDPDGASPEETRPGMDQDEDAPTGSRIPNPVESTGPIG
ncbi:MAG: MFS transporter, partial [Acidimicrobiia bacterium]|nr:MFS transporter [Acidimicrobiia bacterium]